MWLTALYLLAACVLQPPVLPDAVMTSSLLSAEPADQGIVLQEEAARTQDRRARGLRAAPQREEDEREPPQENRAGGEPAAAPEVVAPDSSVRFEAVVYRLKLSTENAVQIDVAELAQMSDLVDFDKALRDLGEAELLYRVDQRVALDDSDQAPSRRVQPRIMISTAQPYVSGIRPGDDGEQRTAIARSQIGVTFEWAGRPVPGPAPAAVLLTLNVQLSGLEPSGVRLGPDVTSPVFREVEQVFTGAVKRGEPIVLLSLDGATPDADGRASAYITRVKLSTPE